MWLLSPAAEVLFRKAKERIYKVEKVRPTQDIPNPLRSKLIPVLEVRYKCVVHRPLASYHRKEIFLLVP